MTKRRITVEEYVRSYDSTGKPDKTETFVKTAEVTGTEKVVAGFLRALADEIDSPRSYS